MNRRLIVRSEAEADLIEAANWYEIQRPGLGTELGAKTHGAKILMEPKDFEYGERQFTAEDLAGHQWTFSETLEDVDPASWGGELMLSK